MMERRVIQIGALLAVIFAAGIVVGFVLGPRLVPSAVPAVAPPLSRGMSAEERVDFRLGELDKRLQLTPEQEKAIRPLLENHMSEVQRLNGIRRRRGRELFERTTSEVRKQLSPSQQSEFDKLQQEAGKIRPDSAKE
jgi:Spy/CpxP family protein refolding chaperone